MTMITVHFQADSWHDIRYQMYAALGLDYPAQPSTTLGQIFDEEEEKARLVGIEPDPDPAPAPKPPKPTSRKPRSTQSAAPPVSEPEPETEPEPELEPEAPPARDIPSTEALKAMVTQAVRLAQKKEGPTRILELLPEFKAKTGLGFVMEATDAHREALANLIDAAGLVSGTA